MDIVFAQALALASLRLLSTSAVPVVADASELPAMDLYWDFPQHLRRRALQCAGGDCHVR